MHWICRLLTVGSAGLLCVLAGCGTPAAVPTVNAPAVIQTTSALPPAIGTAAANATVNAPAAIQTASALPAIVGTAAANTTVNAPAVIQTAAALPAVVGTTAANTMVVQLAAENNSGETGTAVLTELNGKTTVLITVVGEPAGASQPAHIHDGQCGPTLGKVVYPLSDVVNGVSTTTLNVTIAQLKAAKYGLNGHKSAAEIGTYTFCGNLPQ